MVHRTWPLPPTKCFISTLLTKLMVFWKVFQISLTYIFEESLNLHIIVSWLFSLPLRIPEENRAKLKKLFRLKFEHQTWSRVHNASDKQNTLSLFLSAIAVIQLIFWTVDNFCFVGIHSTTNSKNLKTDKYLLFLAHQMQKSRQLKYFKHYHFIGMCSFFAWFNFQTLNFR